MGEKVVRKGKPLHGVYRKVVQGDYDGLQSLAVKAQEGDSRAFNELATRCRPLVEYLSKVHSKRVRATIDDICQEGYVGFIRAVQRFDPDMGKFHHYAASMIKGYLRTAVIKEIDFRAHHGQEGLGEDRETTLEDLISQYDDVRNTVSQETEIKNFNFGLILTEDQYKFILLKYNNFGG